MHLSGRHFRLVPVVLILALGSAAGWPGGHCAAAAADRPLISHDVAVAAVTAAEPAPAPLASIRMAAADVPASRTLSERQRYIIKHYVLRGATVSIVSPVSGEPRQFAQQIGAALKDAGAAVSFDSGTVPATTQTGLVVQYDHTVPADSSVFLALDRAGLNPHNFDIPGAPVVNISVGPKT